MRAEEFLSQAIRLEGRINRAQERIENLRSLAERITVGYGSEAVSHTRNTGAMEDSVLRIVEAERAVNEDLEKLIELKAEIADVIERVADEKLRTLLELKYLKYLSVNAIADEMCYTRRWVNTLHTQALTAVDAVLAGRTLPGSG